MPFHMHWVLIEVGRERLGLCISPCIGGIFSENRSYTAISVETVIFKVTLSKESSLKPPFLGKKMMVLLDPISKLFKRKICVTAH